MAKKKVTIKPKRVPKRSPKIGEKSEEKIKGAIKDLAPNKLPSRVVKTKSVRALMRDKKYGLRDEQLLKPLKQALSACRLHWSKSEGDFLEEIDWPTRLKALELAFKLKGYLNPKFDADDGIRVKEINVNFNLREARDVDEVKKLLTGMPKSAAREAVLEAAEVVEGEVEEDEQEQS